MPASISPASSPVCKPAPSIHVRHTVGLLDALTRPRRSGKRLDDGLPESLEEVIAAYGHRYFKLKVSGKADADIERLAQIAAVLDRLDAYQSRSTATSSIEEAGAVMELWRRIGEDRRLARLKSSMMLLEQPIARVARAAASRSASSAAQVPVEIDESDSDYDVFPACAVTRLSRHFGQVLQGFLSRHPQRRAGGQAQCRRKRRRFSCRPRT